MKTKLSDSRKSILYVIGTLDVGGTERHLAMVAPELVRRGWTVSVFSLAGDGPVRSLLERGGVKLELPPYGRSGGSRRLPARVFRLAAAAASLFVLLVRRRPTIVHFFLPAAYLVGAPLALVTRVPIRIMSRRSLNNYQSARPMVRRIEQILHRSMHVALGNSRSVVRQLAEEGVPSDRTGLIYNGLDLSPYADIPDRERGRQLLGIPANAPVLGIVANLIPYKGHRDLIDALRIAAPALPAGWRLLVVGRDEGIGKGLADLAARHGIAENVLFVGQRADIPNLLSLCDIGVSASHEEGFSNAVLESMAAGLSIIATNVGGNAEAVVDGQSGMLVPAKNPERLATAILQLANSPELRACYGEAARTRVRTTFSLDVCIEQYERLYDGLLQGRGDARSLAEQAEPSCGSDRLH